MARRLARKDPQVVAELYDCYGTRVYNIIWRVVGNRDTAEDLVQETFLRVWSRGQLMDLNRGGLGSWIFTVARHRAIDYLRSTESRLAAGAVDLAWIEAKSTHPQLEAIDHQRRAHLLRNAFEQLMPRERTVIELAYFEGLSQTAMAARLNQPLGTIKTWVRSALRKLRMALNELAKAA